MKSTGEGAKKADEALEQSKSIAYGAWETAQAANAQISLSVVVVTIMLRTMDFVWAKDQSCQTRHHGASGRHIVRNLAC